MGKTHSKPLAARHGNGMLCVNRPLVFAYVPVCGSRIVAVFNTKNFSY